MYIPSWMHSYVHSIVHPKVRSSVHPNVHSQGPCNQQTPATKQTTLPSGCCCKTCCTPGEATCLANIHILTAPSDANKAARQAAPTAAVCAAAKTHCAKTANQAGQHLPNDVLSHKHLAPLVHLKLRPHLGDASKRTVFSSWRGCLADQGGLESTHHTSNPYRQRRVNHSCTAAAGTTAAIAANEAAQPVHYKNRHTTPAVNDCSLQCTCVGSDTLLSARVDMVSCNWPSGPVCMSITQYNPTALPAEY